MHSRKPPEALFRNLLRTRSGAMRSVVQTAERLVDRDVPILITGESGTGKNLLAEVIHAAGPRAAAPFVQIDCASIPLELFESEIFGYEKGTFTDAASRKLGKLEAALGGTVLFDEIAALTPSMQAKLLRAIEEKRFTRLGGAQNVAFAARVISSTSSDLASLVANGRFRSDLLYRINVVTLTLPPLRERREDIARLAKTFLRGANRKMRGFDDDVLAVLCAYPWPGNVRELRNVVERAAIVEQTDRITLGSLPPERFGSAELAAAAASAHWTLEQLELHYIRAILRETRENYSRAAGILGINRKTLLEKRRKYGLE